MEGTSIRRIWTSLLDGDWKERRLEETLIGRDKGDPDAVAESGSDVAGMIWVQYGDVLSTVLLIIPIYDAVVVDCFYLRCYCC